MKTTLCFGMKIIVDSLRLCGKYFVGRVGCICCIGFAKSWLQPGCWICTCHDQRIKSTSHESEDGLQICLTQYPIITDHPNLYTIKQVYTLPRKICIKISRNNDEITNCVKDTLRIRKQHSCTIHNCNDIGRRGGPLYLFNFNPS